MGGQGGRNYWEDLKITRVCARLTGNLLQQLLINSLSVPRSVGFPLNDANVGPYLSRLPVIQVW